MYATEARRSSTIAAVIADPNNNNTNSPSIQKINFEEPSADYHQRSRSRSKSVGGGKGGTTTSDRKSDSIGGNNNKNKKGMAAAAAASSLTVTPAYKAVHRVHTWDETVEENYRFQCAGFRDLRDFEETTGENYLEKMDRWPHNGYIKKLVRKDGCFMYFNRNRECIDKEVHKVKLYKY
ncbi:uncharacterized protein LOC142348333 [Convolutriloba macropyga]|uniref:uncharacterized protein LOC142348333 n=1 Tax=Convolutriloba macropyga TaxID=536237 RepID=UPI003F526569